MDDLVKWGTEFSAATSAAVAGYQTGLISGNSYTKFGDSGFKQLFQDPISSNQVRHAIGGLLAGYINLLGDNAWGKFIMNDVRESLNVDRMSAEEKAKHVRGRNADRALNNFTVRIGSQIADKKNGHNIALSLAAWIRDNLCEPKPKGAGGRAG